jgi:hypothetical protein
MGTRRSRHNKGRKPLYKDYRTVAADLIRGRAPHGGYLWENHMGWTDEFELKLQVLCEADIADFDAVEHVMARNASACFWRARERHLIIPREWVNKFQPSRYVKKNGLRPPKESPLAYPYIQRVRTEHADLLAINALIPKTIPDDRRADMCQEIAIAILEGRTTLADLQAKSAKGNNSAYFIRKFWKDNFEDGGQALAFSIVDDDNKEFMAASAIAAREWHDGELNERRVYRDSFRAFTPTQIEAVWDDNITRAQMSFHEAGKFLSRDEIERMLEEYGIEA